MTRSLLGVITECDCQTMRSPVDGMVPFDKKRHASYVELT
jgi:hypothetical protein